MKNILVILGIVFLAFSAKSQTGCSTGYGHTYNATDSVHWGNCDFRLEENEIRGVDTFTYSFYREECDTFYYSCNICDSLVIEYNKEIQTGTFTDDVIIGEVPKYEGRAAYNTYNLYSCNSLDTFSYQFTEINTEISVEIYTNSSRTFSGAYFWITINGKLITYLLHNEDYYLDYYTFLIRPGDVIKFWWLNSDCLELSVRVNSNNLSNNRQDMFEINIER